MRLIEHFVTAFETDKELKEQYLEQVWSIL